MSMKSDSDITAPSLINILDEMSSEISTGFDPSASRLNDHIRILKSDTCLSLTGRSTLGYQLGRKGDSELYIRLVSNTASGFFSREWIACITIEQLINGAVELTSTSFKILFPNKSVNTGGFVMAVIKALGLIQTNELNSRWHEYVVDMTFEKVIAEISTHVESINENVESKSLSKRKSKEV